MADVVKHLPLICRSGEIALIEFLVEIQFYYDTLVKAMETRRAMNKAVAELKKWN